MQKVAVVGLGKIGLLHAAILRQVRNARLEALVDRSPGILDSVRSAVGEAAPLYDSLEVALARHPIDAVYVCTPQFAHWPVVRQCLERGLHVFTEKPMAHTLSDACAMHELATQKNVRHAVGYMKLHYPHYQKVDSLLKSGVIGQILRGEATMNFSQVFRPSAGWIYKRSLSGGGILMNSGCHALALLSWWLGEVASVSATLRSIHSKEVEDEADVTLTFASGTKVRLRASWSVPGYPVERTAFVFEGTLGRIEADDTGARWEWRDGKGSPRGESLHRSAVDHAAFDISPDYGGEGYFNESQEFIDCCEAGRTPSVDFGRGLKVQKILDTIYESYDRPAVPDPR